MLSLLSRFSYTILPVENVYILLYYEDMKNYEDISIALLLHDFHNEYSVTVYKGAISAYIGVERFLDYAASMGDIPSAHVGIRRDSLLTFGIDNYSGMYDAVNHLITEHDRKKIAYISGTHGVYEADVRFKAYKQALIDNNIAYDERYVYDGSFLREDGVSAVKAFLDERKIVIDGLVGANDHMALYAMKELQNRGISVPEQVSIVGFDDLSSARSCTPALTTVHQSAFELASFAMRRLAEGIRDDKIEMRHEQLPARLTVRQSCGCQAGTAAHCAANSEESPDTLSEKDRSEWEEQRSFVNLMTRDMIGNFEIDEILSVLNGHLNYLGIRDFSLSQYVGQG